MNKMKRTVAFIAVVVGMTLAGGAAQAASSISLIWASTSTPTITGTVNSQTITALIVLAADSVDGVAAVDLDFTFDTAELDFVKLTEPGVNLPGMGNAFSPIVGGHDFLDEAAGIVEGFDQATTATGCIGCTVTLGSIQFHVVAPVGDASALDDVVATGTVLSALATTPTVFAVTAGAEVEANTVPEPTTALLVVGGLLGLGYAGRRSVR